MKVNKVKISAILVDSGFISENGESYAVISDSKGNIFEGNAKLNPEDLSSNYIGCQIAESRAIIKMIKRDIAEKRIELKAIKTFFAAAKDTVGYDHNHMDARIESKMRKQIFMKQRELDGLIEAANFFKQNISNLGTSRESFYAAKAKKEERKKEMIDILSKKVEENATVELNHAEAED